MKKLDFNEGLELITNNMNSTIKEKIKEHLNHLSWEKIYSVVNDFRVYLIYHWKNEIIRTVSFDIRDFHKDPVNMREDRFTTRNIEDMFDILNFNIIDKLGFTKFLKKDFRYDLDKNKDFKIPIIKDYNQKLLDGSHISMYSDRVTINKREDLSFLLYYGNFDTKDEMFSFDIIENIEDYERNSYLEVFFNNVMNVVKEDITSNNFKRKLKMYLYKIKKRLSKKYYYF